VPDRRGRDGTCTVTGLSKAFSRGDGVAGSGVSAWTPADGGDDAAASILAGGDGGEAR
jgi:hypothetical protein